MHVTALRTYVDDAVRYSRRSGNIASCLEAPQFCTRRSVECVKDVVVVRTYVNHTIRHCGRGGWIRIGREWKGPKLRASRRVEGEESSAEGEDVCRYVEGSVRYCGRGIDWPIRRGLPELDEVRDITGGNG